MRWLLALLLLPAVACAEPVPSDLRKLLDKAEAVELISLDPSVDGAKDGFHGYKVMGSVKLETKERAKLLAAFYKGIADSDGVVAACFIPRHGLRAMADGKTVEVVICYQCLSMKVYIGGKAESALTTGDPAETLNAMLKAAKVPLPRASGE